MKKIVLLFILICFTVIPLCARRNIMMTGYWSPTSEMIYQFSNDPQLNPDGWIGENWEDSGYDVYAFFPAFNRETRDFEVDYQATWEDFWATVEEYNPIAIISYGAGAGPWEIEYNARNLSYWVSDYEYPYQPTPCPPDSSVAVNYVRHSTLPVSEIEAAVDAGTSLNAWVDWNGNPGMFLCEYMAYLGMWYQDIHSSADDEYPCLSAGFTHVNASVDIAEATEAAQITLRTVIDYLHQFIDLEGTVITGGVNPEGTEITLVNENQIEFRAVADDEGHFMIPLLPAGTYTVTAFLGRYYYYEGTAEITSANPELEIELIDYPQLEALTWCSGASQQVNTGSSINIQIANVFDAEDLAPYANCHLRELIVTSAIDESDGNMEFVLYKGTPGGTEPVLIMMEQFIYGFSAGEEYHLWLDDLDVLDDVVWEQGLTVACHVTSNTGAVGWMDNEPAVAGKGNMIKVSGQWLEAPDILGVDGNWDIRLGFYGETITAGDENIIQPVAELINYPNPFNPTTWIRYNCPDNHQAELSIYNIKGELVRQVDMINNKNGWFDYCWNGENSSGNRVASGIYLARVKSGSSSSSQKMLMIK